MISSTPYADFRSTVQSSLALEAGRTLRWKPIEEREAIVEHLVTHWNWVESSLTPFWEPLAELYNDDAGAWAREQAEASRKLLKAFDLRLTVLIQQAWLRILFERKAARDAD